MRLQYAKFYLARINLVYLLTGSHTASVKIRVSQDFHYWHFGPDTSFLRGDYHVNSRKFISIPHPFSSCGNQVSPDMVKYPLRIKIRPPTPNITNLDHFNDWESTCLSIWLGGLKVDRLWCSESDLLDSKSENISYIGNVKQWDLTDFKDYGF